MDTTQSTRRQDLAAPKKRLESSAADDGSRSRQTLPLVDANFPIELRGVIRLLTGRGSVDRCTSLKVRIAVLGDHSSWHSHINACHRP